MAASRPRRPSRTTRRRASSQAGGSILGHYNSATAILLPTSKVLLIGPGFRDPSAELYDPASGKSALLPVQLPSGALGATTSAGYDALPETGSLLKDGRALLCIFDYLVTYDSATGSFTQSGSISAPGSGLNWP